MLQELRIEPKLSHPKLLPPRIDEKFYKSNITSINKQNMNSHSTRTRSITSPAQINKKKEKSS